METKRWASVETRNLVGQALPVSVRFLGLAGRLWAKPYPVSHDKKKLCLSLIL